MKTKLQILLITLLLSITASFSQTGYNAYLINEIADNVSTASQVGQVFTFTLDIQNTSNNVLYEFSLSSSLDNNMGSIIPLNLSLINGDINNNNLLDANEIWTYTSTYTVTQDDIDITAMPNGVGVILNEVIITNFYNGNLINTPIVSEAYLSIEDQDGDGVINDQEVNDNTDYTNSCDFLLVSQTVDTSGYWNEFDCDGDGVNNFFEINNGTNPLVVDVFDNDGDGVTNEQEVIDGTDSNDGCDFLIVSVTVFQSNEWFNGDCDGDGVSNEEEFFGSINYDSDNDGVLDIFDIDDDNDGIITLVEFQHGNTDGDNFPNYLDTDSDNDNIPDNVEAQPTNSFIPPAGLDSNGDGLDDAYDGLGLSYNLMNTDSDPNNEYDYIDSDSDNDGFLDIDEGIADDDGDGIPNYRDVSCIPVGTPQDIAICSGVNLQIDLELLTSGENNTFNWYATNNSEVSGETLTSSSSNFILDMLVNNTSTVQDVVYTIVPVSMDFCEGNAFQIVVVVNPIPLGVDSNITINSGEVLDLDLNTLVSLSGNTFNWSAQDNPNVNGETTDTTSSSIIADVLQNDTGTIQTVIYQITPYNNTGFCEGNNLYVTVMINPTCAAPINFNFSYIYADSASLNWDSGNATAWQLQFEGNITDLSTAYYDFTNLIQDTAYTYEVRSLCSTGIYSNWISGTFQTSILPPSCGGIFTDTGGSNGNYGNNEDRITTIFPENDGDVVSVTFTSFATEGGYDYLQIYEGDSVNGNLIDTIGGTAIAVPVTYTSTDSTGALTFKFHSDVSVTKAGWEANITCGLPPTCIPISNITATPTYYTIVGISFQDNNTPNATEWEVEYGETGFIQGTGTTIVTPAQSLSIDNLTQFTTYDVYVRSSCGNGDYSLWVGPMTYIQDFDCTAPVGNNQISFNIDDNATIADLVAQLSGNNVYISNVNDCNTQPMENTTLLINGTTYYAFQDGCCQALTVTVAIQNIAIDTPYTVDTIPYQMYNQPLPNTFNVDDGYTDLIPLNFNFNYFEYDYNQITIGTNSVISFNVNDANNFCAWNIANDNIIPSSFVIDNAVLGAYQDYFNPAGGTQGYGFIGTAPFRKFIVFFDDVALYSCNDILSANQIILYETYNFIDVQVKDRNVCSWNNGNAIIGIQSIGGQYAYFPEGRNTGNWEAHNEGHRFRPEYNVPDFQYIICDVNVDGVETFDLNVVINNFNDGSSTYSIFETINDAQNDTNQISGMYTNTSNSQTIFVRELSLAGNVSIKRVLLAAIDCGADYDLDSVATLDEDLNGNGNFGDDDTDNDGIPNFIDEDDDGDFVLTDVEAVVTTNKDNSSSTQFIDTDGDNIPNYLDNDDDGDGVLTINEDYDGDGNPANDDTNNDGIYDYLQQSVALGVENSLVNKFSIYPNPAKESLTIVFNNLQTEVNINIYSVQGQLVYSKNDVIDTLQVNIANLSTGIYFVKVNDDNLITTKKFVKE